MFPPGSVSPSPQTESQFGVTPVPLSSPWGVRVQFSQRRLIVFLVSRRTKTGRQLFEQDYRLYQDCNSVFKDDPALLAPDRSCAVGDNV